MELSYDWKSFQSFFYSKRRLALGDFSQTGPLYLVLQKREVVCAFSEGGEDLSKWIGATLDEVVADHQNRELITYEREKVDEWVETAMGLPHFFDQIQDLRTEIRVQSSHRNRLKSPETWIHRHFLLQAFQSWWRKIFPSSFGIYIRLTEKGAPDTSLFLVVKRGRISSFHVPDLNSMITDRRKHAADVVKFLSSRYLVPVQGIFVSAAEWNEWSELSNPWPKVVEALKSDRNKLVPFQWSLMILIRIRGYLGF